jgi:hypothetical protein
VFPYDWLDELDKLDSKELPSRQDFYNLLRNKECSEQEYLYAHNVWDRFKCKTMRDYLNIYLKNDVLVLADVFENFRNNQIKNYHLDPAHYITLPNFAWDAMLYNTNVTIDLLDDAEMYRVIESNIRGGISVITQRLAIANNPLVPNYNPFEKTSWIIYFDAVNLYGKALSYPLPIADFEWVKNEDVMFDDIMRAAEMGEASNVGYFVEVDLEYTETLHDYFNDYPPAPERVKMSTMQLSEKQITIQRAYDTSRAQNYSKLLGTLLHKKRYLTHFWNLHFYIQHGVVVTKIRRIIRFKQAPFIKHFIEKNSQLRLEAKTTEEKDSIKKTNNCLYGKSCENLRKRSDIRLIIKERDAQRLIKKPHCTMLRIFDQSLVGFELRKISSIIDKPTFIGFAVLELSKLIMYKFHYDYIVETFGTDAHLLFTDTDSLCYQFDVPDIYASLKETGMEHLDTSNYPKEHALYSNKNAGIVGKMKDETSGKPVHKVAALKSKMYSIVIAPSPDAQQQPEIEKHVAKGIQANAMENIRFEDYMNQLMRPEENRLVNRRITSNLHKLYSVAIDKRALSAFDDKRWLLEDGIHTLAFGHKDIKSTLLPDVQLTNGDVVLENAEAPARMRRRLLQLNNNGGGGGNVPDLIQPPTGSRSDSRGSDRRDSDITVVDDAQELETTMQKQNQKHEKRMKIRRAKNAKFSHGLDAAFTNVCTCSV